MEFFDVFIFNNIKSDIKIILCQPNKVVSEIKVLSTFARFLLLKSGATDKPCGEAVQTLTQKHVAKRHMIVPK